MTDRERVQSSHPNVLIKLQYPGQLSFTVTDSPLSTQVVGQVTFTANVKSSPVVVPALPVGVAHPGAFTGTSTVKVMLDEWA